MDLEKEVARRAISVFFKDRKITEARLAELSATTFVPIIKLYEIIVDEHKLEEFRENLDKLREFYK